MDLLEKIRILIIYLKNINFDYKQYSLESIYFFPMYNFSAYKRLNCYTCTNFLVKNVIRKMFLGVY